jgi:hypothetical protein
MASSRGDVLGLRYRRTYSCSAHVLSLHKGAGPLKHGILQGTPALPIARIHVARAALLRGWTWTVKLSIFPRVYVLRTNCHCTREHLQHSILHGGWTWTAPSSRVLTFCVPSVIAQGTH